MLKMAIHSVRAARSMPLEHFPNAHTVLAQSDTVVTAGVEMESFQGYCVKELRNASLRQYGRLGTRGQLPLLRSPSGICTKLIRQRNGNSRRREGTLASNTDLIARPRQSPLIGLSDCIANMHEPGSGGTYDVPPRAVAAAHGGR